MVFWDSDITVLTNIAVAQVGMCEHKHWMWVREH